jgi:predicted DNA-binding transcriptional regulator AlpA
MHKMNDVAARVFGPAYAGRRYLRVDELIAIGVARNASTIRNLVRRGDLPAPIKMGRLLLFPAEALAERLSVLTTEENTCPP